MYSRRQVCDRLAIHPQVLDDFVEEFRALFRSEYKFSMVEVKLLGLIKNARRQGYEDHHAVWTRLLLYLRERPELIRRLANRSVTLDRYLQAITVTGQPEGPRRDPLVAEITKGVMFRLRTEAQEQTEETEFDLPDAA